jgi:hypothetical protein
MWASRTINSRENASCGKVHFMLFSWSPGGGPRGPLLQLYTVCLTLPPKHRFFMRISLWPGAETQIEFRSIGENRRRQIYIRFKLDKLRIPQRGPRAPHYFPSHQYRKEADTTTRIEVNSFLQVDCIGPIEKFCNGISNLSLLPRKVVSIAQVVKLRLETMARYLTITFLPTKFEDTTLAKCNSLRQEARFLCIPLSQ